MASQFVSTDAVDGERWAAVLRRDPAADGRFVYAVASTGVYCRPSCPSRPTRRENVAFYADAGAAERAGFRACLRCTPAGASPADRRCAAIARSCRLIECAESLPKLDALAAAAGMSRYHFHRVFKDVTGVTPKAYAQARRAERVRRALTAEPTVTQAIYDSGYNASSRFYDKARDQLGMRPTAYRNGGEGMRIRFAVGRFSLGDVLVAATAEGVCAILLGDDPASLLRDLQDQFVRAELIGADPDFESVVAQVVGLIDAPERSFGLPLDVRGTAFQHRVWDALRTLPAGQTVSYADLAASVGHPRAVRAVAQACAANRLAVAIPCHRVVRTDGALSGYRWGIERKRALLDRERRDAKTDPATGNGTRTNEVSRVR